MTSKHDRWGKNLICLTFLAFLALCFRQWTRPPIEDEVLMHQGALIWLEKGADRFEMSHTPLYLESLSLWQKIWGAASVDKPDNIRILRSFGVLTSSLTLALFLIGLYSHKRSKSAGQNIDAQAMHPTLADIPVLAAALLILHPYFIQSALLLDYDTSWLGPLLFLPMLLIERWDGKERPSPALALGISITLSIALMAKELTPMIFIALWPFWAYLRKWRAKSAGWKPHFAQAALGSFVSIVIFLALLAGWAKWRGFNWYDPLLLTKEKFLGRYGSSRGLLPWNAWGLGRFLFLSYIPFLWIGAPVCFALWSGLKAKGKKLRDVLGSLAKLPFSLWSSIAIFAAYTWIVQASFYFPKYTAPAWPLLLYGLARSLRIDGNFVPRQASRFRIAFGLATLFALGFIPALDPLMIIENRSRLTFHTLAAHVLSLALPIIGLWVFGKAWSKTAKIPNTKIDTAKNLGFLIGLVAYCAGVSIGQATRDRQANYLYGEGGFEEAMLELRELRQRLYPNEPILSSARDIYWAMLKESTYLDLEKPEAERLLNIHRILVSRTYGFNSIASDSAWKQKVERRYPCHREVNTEGHRFEWWWIPPSDSIGCE